MNSHLSIKNKVLALALAIAGAAPLIGTSQSTTGWLRTQGITWNVTPYVGILKKVIDGATHPGIRFDRWAQQIDGTQGADYRGKKYYPGDFNGQLRPYFNAIEVKGVNGRADFNIGGYQIRVKDFANFYNLGMYGEAYSVATSLRKDEDVVITRVNITGGQLTGVEDLWKKIDELEAQERDRKKKEEFEERERLKREAEKKAADEAARKAAEQKSAEARNKANNNSNSGTSASAQQKNQSSSQSNTASSSGGTTTSSTSASGSSGGSSRSGSSESSGASSFGTVRTSPIDLSNTSQYFRDNQGNYYEKIDNRRFRQVTQTDYESGRQSIEQNRKISEQQKKIADQRYADSALAAIKASSNNVLERNRSAQQESERWRDLMSQNFYAAQQLTEARSNFQEKSKLADRYNSVEELERDYRQKVSGLSASANQLAEAKNQSLQSNYEYQFRDADASGRALGQAVVGVGSIINSISADKQAERARRELAEARAAALKKMEKERKEGLIAARKKLINDFPDGGTPLSAHRVSTNEVYLFAYTTDPMKLEADMPTLAVTPVFPVGKRSDGTWPFKSSIVGEVNRLSQSQTPTLFGYFASKEKAEEWNAAFLRMAKQSGFQVKSISYAGKPTSIRKESSTTPPESTTDFFGNPLKGSESKSEPKSESKKTKLDFFGNPIKE